MFYDIRNEWSVLPWFNTGGTRAKKYMQSPEGKFFFFKRSQYKDPTPTKPKGKDYKYEFWSEIIAYEIGAFLGFDVLKYEIAYDGISMGCISESMINSEREQLIEGIRFLQGYDPNYKPESKDHRKFYTFQAIEAALDKFGFSWLKKHIVEVLIFDSIIGNGDRHQENWAVILDHAAMVDAFNRTHAVMMSEKRLLPKEEAFDPNLVKFAPIYDSGSSLGRELTDQKVNELLNNNERIISYINKGVSEVHWFSQKISHFELVNNLLHSPYREFVHTIVNRVVRKFDEEAIDLIVERVDICLPEFVRQFTIPPNRKQLIAKFIKYRIKRLRELLNA